MTRSFVHNYSRTFLLHNFLILAFSISHRVNGFLLKHSSSGLPIPSTRFEDNSLTTNEAWLKRRASSLDAVALDGRYSETNSSLNENNRENRCKETETVTTTRYPWSELQQWALRDNLPNYVIRIPIKQNANKQEDTILSTFALWRSLQNDVPELSGYPISFLQDCYAEMNKEKQSQNESSESSDESDKTVKKVELPTTPGVLPFLQEYEFSSGGGISGYVYGMDGVSDGSRIETSAVKNINESLPKGFVQTSDGCASFELGNPLQTDVQQIGDKSTFTTTSLVKDLGLDKIPKAASANQLQTLMNEVDDGDGILLRLGALSGFFLAGATAINMLSHHLTVNVFWV